MVLVAEEGTGTQPVNRNTPAMPSSSAVYLRDCSLSPINLLKCLILDINVYPGFCSPDKLERVNLNLFCLYSWRTWAFPAALHTQGVLQVWCLCTQLLCNTGMNTAAHQRQQLWAQTCTGIVCTDGTRTFSFFWQLLTASHSRGCRQKKKNKQKKEYSHVKMELLAAPSGNVSNPIWIR